MASIVHLISPLLPFKMLCGEEDYPPGPYLQTTSEVRLATCPDCLEIAPFTTDYKE